jgi:hypothetical protein
MDQCSQFAKYEETKSLNRYSPNVGNQMWKIKEKWNKLPIEEREKYRNIKCFTEMFDGADFKQNEWKRMFELCKEFEVEKKVNICPSQEYLENPIGKWLSAQKRMFTGNSGGRKMTENMKRLLTLNTFFEWNQTRKKTSYENMNDTFDKFFEHAKTHVPPSKPSKKPVISKTSLYAILGVPKNATLNDIKTAYKNKARILHPDKGGNTEEFKVLKDAYETLSDPERKIVYDNTI